MLHALSSVVLVLVGAGLYFRRRRPALHWKFMVLAFVTDVLLVLYIEATRGAVEQVATQVRLLLWFHAGVSLAVLVLYAVLLGIGRKLLAVPEAWGAGRPEGPGRVRRLHRNLGVTFCVLRLLNYATAFMV
jgi:hypothetical protein